MVFNLPMACSLGSRSGCMGSGSVDKRQDKMGAFIPVTEHRTTTHRSIPDIISC